ncbi:MAG: (2Fe-2S)-binding protein [Acidimicrobiia bacterium]|nr:(2Fe-2S)-binding protein [Acidimicrobiia bacterium]
MTTHPITVEVNGVAYERSVSPRLLLSDFLRHELHLTGTHVGCEHGVCGACTVQFNGEGVRSCLLFAVQADGSTIKTVEGLANGDSLHPLQEAFSAAHALQCGFCTPGFLMAIDSMLDQLSTMSEAEIREALSGNICRCTGYQGIVEAVQATVASLQQEGR